MTKWEYMSISPDDWREERKITESWDNDLRAKLEPPIIPHEFNILFGDKSTYMPSLGMIIQIPYYETKGYWHTWEGWLNHLGSQGWEVCISGGEKFVFGYLGDSGLEFEKEFMVILKRKIK